MRSLRLSTVLIGGVILGLTVPNAVSTYRSLKKQKQQLTSELQAEHKRITQIVAMGMPDLLWNLDKEGTQPLLKSVFADPKVVEVTILGTDKSVFVKKTNETPDSGSVLSKSGNILRDGKAIGAAEVKISTGHLDKILGDRLSETLIATSIQLAIMLSLLVILLNNRVLSPVSLLVKQAQRISRRNLSESFHWKRSDEIGVLGQTLEFARGALKGLFEEIESKNAALEAANTNLERVVEERTAQIRTILNNVKSGFFLVSQGLKVQNGYSKSCLELLSCQNIENRVLTELLGIAVERHANFNLLVDQVFEDFLPESVSLDQLPKRFSVCDRILALEGSTVRNLENKVEFILFTLTDISDLEKAEREASENKMLIRILQSMDSFRSFIHETKVGIQAAKIELAKENQTGIREQLHTLKGNSGAFGLMTLSRLVHDIEDKRHVDRGDLIRIEEEVCHFLNTYSDILHVRYEMDSEEVFHVKRSQIEELNDRVQVLQNSTLLFDEVQAWLATIQQKPASALLGPVDDYVEKLAHDLGKSVKISISGGDTPMRPDVMLPVAQNLIHLIRNAIDHGIEDPWDRGTKPACASIEVSFSETSDSWRVLVRDDGKGIDTQKVLAKALEAQIITPESVVHFTEQDIVQLVFRDGFSTRSSASEISGRGVGMSAFANAVHEAGGNLKVRTTSGQGTEFDIEIPKRKWETGHGSTLGLAPTSAA
jgi:two-component system chemotaxis sensor kinase CheA